MIPVVRSEAILSSLSSATKQPRAINKNAIIEKIKEDAMEKEREEEKLQNE